MTLEDFLIPISHFRTSHNILENKVKNFIAQIENRTLNKSFPGAITSFVKQNDSLLDAYQKLISKTKKLRLWETKNFPF